MAKSMRYAGSTLVVLSWLAFLVSLGLPAVQFRGVEPYMGWMAAWAIIVKIPESFSDLSSVFFGLVGVGNILIVFAPAALFYSAKRLYKFTTLFYMVVFFIALAFYDEGCAAGYYLWIASLLGVSVGFGLLSRIAPYNNRLQIDAAAPRD
jgi:hypothetical protein